MPYDEAVAARVRNALADDPRIVERRMFGGIAFLLGGNMCCGVQEDRLMVRVGPDAHADAFARPHARPMDFTKKPLRGFVYVDPPGFADDPALEEWVGRGVAFAASLPAKSPR